MRDQLVKFETAKLAKEKGFDFVVINHEYDPGCFGYFERRSNKQVVPISYVYADTNQNIQQYNDLNTPAPTQSLLQKWIREVHKYNMEITLFNGWWCFIIKTLPSDKDIAFAASGECQDGDLWLDSECLNLDWYSAEFKSYEDALEEGLKSILKLL